MINRLINKWKSMKLLRKIATILIFSSLIFLISNCRLISYGIQQGVGQIRMVNNAVPISDLMKNPLISDSLKQKFLLVEEIKKFAFDSLGLNPSKNYNTFYDQKGKPILWITVACEAYEMKAYTWKFPIVGRVPYKGYFKKQDAVDEAEKLKAMGYDSRVGTVSAWSTLGFFKDPILSDMLDQSEGQIARLIIHELTHSTLYVKGNAQFSENLATFVGDEGAKFYIQQKYGLNSLQYREYVGELSDVEKFSSHILKGANLLDSLYRTFSEELAGDIKKEKKFQLIKQIMNDLDTITFYIPSKFPKLQNPNSLPNNAFFIGYITYHKDQNIFMKEFQSKFNSDFPSYLYYLKSQFDAV